jgi:hypothetical protein
MDYAVQERAITRYCKCYSKHEEGNVAHTVLRLRGTSIRFSSMASESSCTVEKYIRSGTSLNSVDVTNLLTYIQSASTKPGVYRSEGIFDLQPFYDAATEAGIYLIARPGPYINAEVSGGGFPGWIQRINGTLRTRATDFLNATDKYEKFSRS